MNASRILALGGSICHVLRGSEALGGPRSNEAVKPGRCAKEGLHVRGGSELGPYEDLAFIMDSNGVQSVPFYHARPAMGRRITLVMMIMIMVTVMRIKARIIFIIIRTNIKGPELVLQQQLVAQSTFMQMVLLNTKVYHQALMMETLMKIVFIMQSKLKILIIQEYQELKKFILVII